MEILPITGGLVLTQRKFAKELLAEFGDPEATSVVCPLDSTHKLAADQGDFFENPSLYRKIVGKLNFLTNTRPDNGLSLNAHLYLLYHALANESMQILTQKKKNP